MAAATVTVEVGTLTLKVSCDHGFDDTARMAGALVKAIVALEGARLSRGGPPLGDLVILELGGSLMPAHTRRENTPVPTPDRQNEPQTP